MHRNRLDANVYIGLLLLFFIIPHQLKSQILPKEGSVLNYRLIGFYIPASQQANGYILEIATGNYNSEDSFRRNIIKSISHKENKVIVEVPSFGCQYTWQAIYKGNHASKAKSPLHHFTTGIVPEVDTAGTRVRVLKNNEQFNGSYICLNGSKAIYDVKGKPVWFLPGIDGVSAEALQIQDFKPTTSGTITFLTSNSGYEINYAGDILWKTPNTATVSGDNIEHYHHEFTKLFNGHYMVLGTEFVQGIQQLPSGSNDSSVTVRSDRKEENDKNPNTVNNKIPFGTVIEYDNGGKVVWSWKSSQYFKESDVEYYRSAQQTKMVDVHENAFFFDENAKTVYIGFRDIGRIIKVKYPEGNVMNAYGEKYTPGNMAKNDGLFFGQHSINKSYENLYVYNNNPFNYPTAPKIMMMKESSSGGDKLEKIWEYQFTIEDSAALKKMNNIYTAGGNVIELPDKSIFTSINIPYNGLFIVNLDKEVLWSAVVEKWNPDKKTWIPFPQYRANIISGAKEMEHLIWNAETQFMPPAEETKYKGKLSTH